MIAIYIIAGLLVAVLLIAAFLPGKYHIEKSVIISRPSPEVKNKITDLDHYAKWNPWQQMDPSATKRITGAPGAPGHRYEWDGKKVGAGSLTLRSHDDRHASFDLQFVRPWKSKADDNWNFEDWGDNSTKVTWQNTGSLPYPVGRLMGPMLHKNLNKQFSTGLNNLKKMCEEQ